MTYIMTPLALIATIPGLILVGVGFGNMACYKIALVAATFLDNLLGV